MSVPRLIVLTNAKAGELPRLYLADRDRFPMADLNTRDLGQARVWRFPPGVRRYLSRNAHLVGYRRVWVPESEVADAIAKTGGTPPAVMTEAPATAHPGRQSIRTTKTDPNKRMKRARRKQAVRVLRRVSGKRGRKMARKRRSLLARA